MAHFKHPLFRKDYQSLPTDVRKLADKSFALLKENPTHPSLHFKKVGRFWSARVGAHYRALAIEAPDGLIWFRIVPHEDYDRIIRS
jgi:mRNA-degrading endonuclease RelE of RelBE toxin-antitoxin system